MSEVVIQSEDATTTNLARLEMVGAILVQVASLFLVLDALDTDGTLWPTLAYKVKRWRQKMRGTFVVKVPAWPVIYEAEQIVRGAAGG